MRTYDDVVNEMPGLTCRTWIFSILELLRDDGTFACGDLAAIQREIPDFGNEHAASAVMAVQPRPVRDSGSLLP